jgi:hypothetical protein
VLIKRMGITRDQVKRLEVSADREWLRVVLWDDTVRTIARQQVESSPAPGAARATTIWASRPIWQWVRWAHRLALRL